MRGCLSAVVKIGACLFLLMFLAAMFRGSQRSSEGTRQNSQATLENNARAATHLLIGISPLDGRDPEFPWFDGATKVTPLSEQGKWRAIGDVSLLSGIGNGRATHKFEAVIRNTGGDAWQLLELKVDGEDIR